ncbi:hypothetical protein [Arhodomonas sp. AD133]|uniref:hypothetical protein n=1 Tax=Arhodomonas sp. AD133 TaxID=3415009 RepID=UPI003EBB76AA
MPQHIYSDEYLDHYADRYCELWLHLHGISLLQYLAAPEACERVARKWSDHPEPCPSSILPQEITRAEQALEREAERGLEHCPRRGGAIVEPLHHHRYPRRRPLFARRVKV